MADFISKYTGEEIEARLDKVSELETGKASLWDSEKQYAKGDFCVHKGYLWVCTAEAGNTGTEPSTNYNIWNVTYSNPNLLDNPWFTVNQRGVTSWSNWSYGVDRWKVNSGTATKNGDGSVTLPPGTLLMNRFPGNPFVGKVMTASMLLATGRVVSITFTVINSDTWTSISEINDGDEHILRVNTEDGGDFNISLDSLSSATTNLNVRAVKLELGHVSTLANDTAPDYATELLKCQRYFEVSAFHRSYVKAIGTNTALESDSYFFKVPKRIFPTITVHNTENSFAFNTDSGQNESFTLETPVSYNKDMFCIKLTGNFSTSATYVLSIADAAYWISADL